MRSPRNQIQGNSSTFEIFNATKFEGIRIHFMFPEPELSLQKGAYPTEDLFYGTRFPQRLETCLYSLNVFKTSFHGKDYLNTL